MLQHINLPHQESSIPLDVARPTQDIRGGVLILPSIFGNDEGTLSLAHTLAEHGLLAVVPALFFRQDPGPCGFDAQGKERAFARMRTYQQEEGIQDLLVVVKWMREQLSHNPSAKLLAHGICFGGHLAALLAQKKVVDALTTVHGGRLDQISAQQNLTVPASLHFGDQDSAIPLEKINSVQKHWPQAEVVIHPNAQHGFAHPGSPFFVEDAYQKSLQKIVQLAL